MAEIINEAIEEDDFEAIFDLLNAADDDGVKYGGSRLGRAANIDRYHEAGRAELFWTTSV